MAYPSPSHARRKSGPTSPARGAEGNIWGHDVTCPLPGTTFALRTVAVLAAPTCETVAAFDVRVAGTDIEVEVAGRAR